MRSFRFAATSVAAAAAAAAAAVAGPASAARADAQHLRLSVAGSTATCSSGQFWSAADAHQAWLPAAGAPLSAPIAGGRRLTVTSTQFSRSESADYLLRRQLGPAADSTLTPAANAVTSRILSTVRWRSLVRVGTQSPSDPTTTIGVRNPLRTPARAVEFVSGYRLEVTLSDRRCVNGASRVVTVERRPVYLYSQGHVLNGGQILLVGWVGLGAHARALSLSWQADPVIAAP